MPDLRVGALEAFAQEEAMRLRERAEAKAKELRAAARVAEETKASFFELTRKLRDAVRRFNGAAATERRLRWQESPGLAVKAAAGELYCRFYRDASEVYLALNSLGRSGKPDVYLIEGQGDLGEKGGRFRLRIEGLIGAKEEVVYRIGIDGERVAVALGELAERLVLATVATDRNRLFTAPA